LCFAVTAAGAGCGSDALDGPGDETANDSKDAADANRRTTRTTTPSATTRDRDRDPARSSTTGVRGPTSSGSSSSGTPSSGPPNGPTHWSVTPTSATPPATTSEPTVAPEDDDDEFAWGLPVGDESPSVTEHPLYVTIQRGDCAGAQQFLDENYSLLRSPRAVLLYQAAIDFCAGREPDARAHFEQAATYGWEGIAQPYTDCNVRRAAASVLEQAPPASFPCPAGPGPTWPPDASPDAPKDDPRTAVDESAVTTTVP
jgi:hypothetical protein